MEAKQPEPGSQQNENERVDEEGINVLDKRSSRLFLTACINGKPVSSLVDIGTTLTIISSSVWETIGDSPSSLHSFEQVICTASGNPTDVEG